MPGGQTVVLGIDYGSRRIGIARGVASVGISTPLTTLNTSETVIREIVSLAAREQADRIVVGLPRNLSGMDTEQTDKVRHFGAALQQASALPILYQDEALTSVYAEDELKSRGKLYTKGDIDALAAALILEDYFKRDKSAKV